MGEGLLIAAVSSCLAAEAGWDAPKINRVQVATMSLAVTAIRRPREERGPEGFCNGDTRSPTVVFVGSQ